MIRIEEYVQKPYNVQVHICALEWLKNQGIDAFAGGKLNQKYYVCRARLMELERQTVKNIALMLSETSVAVPLRSLEHRAELFIRQKQEEAEKAKSPRQKEYKIDFRAFLGR